MTHARLHILTLVIYFISGIFFYLQTCLCYYYIHTFICTSTSLFFYTPIGSLSDDLVFARPDWMFHFIDQVFDETYMLRRV